MLQPIFNLLKPNQTRKQTRSAARGGGVACVRLELAGHLVLEGIELLDELGAGVLVEHVPVHEPGRVSEADELHHLGEDGDGVDGADDGAGEPHERRAAGDVGDHRGLVLGVLPLLINGDEKVSECEMERRGRRWFRLFFFLVGGYQNLAGADRGHVGLGASSAYLVGDGLEDLVGADLGVSDSLGGDRALDRELRMWGCDGGAVGDRSEGGWRSLPLVVRSRGERDVSTAA